MGLMSAIANYIVQKAERPDAWSVSSFQQGKPYYPDTDYKSLVNKYTGYVYACAHINAVNCAQVPLRLYVSKPSVRVKALFPTIKVPRNRLDYISKSPTTQRFLTKAVEVEEVTEHPFLDLMNNVNPEMNEFDLREHLFTFLDVVGNSYWYLLKNEYGVPYEIYPLMSQYIKIVPSKEKYIDHFEYILNFNDKKIIPTEEMVHYKYINPKDGYYGLGPLQAAIVAADLHSNMNLYEIALMINRCIPDFAIVYPPEAGEPSKDEQERIKKKWRKQHGGIKQAGLPAILTGGADVKQLSITPKEMAFLEGRKATLQEIAAIFGVPISKLTSENVNRANADAGDAQYMKNTILPRLRKVEQKINEKLLPMFDERLFCSFDNPVPEDKIFRLTQIEKHLQSGYSTVNEERQIDGLDEVEGGDVRYIPMMLVPVGTNNEPTKVIHKSARHLPPLNHPTNFIDRSLIQALQEYFEKQENHILAMFDKKEGKNIKSPVDDFMAGWFDLMKWNGELEGTTKPFVRYTFLAGAERSLRSLVDKPFDPISPYALSSFDNHQAISTSQINQTKLRQIRESISEGMELGENMFNLRKRVENIYEGATRYEAERIARSETIWAWNEGAVQGYKQSGIIKRKRWLSSGDSRSCTSCLAMNGKIIEVDADFFEKGSSWPEFNLNFDYEGINHPPLHPQCRCCIVAVIEG